MRKILIKNTLADPIVRNGLLFGQRKELQTVYKEKEDIEAQKRANELIIDSIAAKVEIELEEQVSKVRNGEVPVSQLCSIILAAEEEFENRVKARIDNHDKHYVSKCWSGIMKRLRWDCRMVKEKNGGNEK